MSASILVTGGTGTLGRLVTPLLRDTGARLRVLSRGSRATEPGVEHVTGDLLKNEGLTAAVAGVDTILHLAGGAKGDAEATANLVRAAHRAGTVRHLVHISVIGADRMPLAWFANQRGAEQAVTESGLPWTMLRAAQFHDLVLTMVRGMSKLPLIPAPGGLRFQPVATADVASRLAELTLGDPAGLVPDLAGPTVYTLDELVRGYLSANGRRRLFLPIRIPGKAGRAYRAGHNLNLDTAVTGEHTWEDFLADRVPA
ncbi:SDR family oxidoreductase [Stackebrandtia nassauensis]|uniref:NmrA family protein n=1 Tax=Stackebrandtia nassauensis (strain DSM 44728 / CIP 108903 / NRRL B-16338 / NBRC 102104 / LLR-40K-21) TaxID=446470 RepID=D3Q2X7_STANL|nr:NAD(P)H-binding protein [Stackebrandtia nassauensis]ADD39947.1 NmrA family protein [Stackebrandtia nassauensis DSM 44728]